MKTIVFIFILFFASSFTVFGQKEMKVKAGKSIDNLYVGKTTLQTIDSTSNYNFIHKSFVNGKGATWTETLNDGLLYEISSNGTCPGLCGGYFLFKNTGDSLTVQKQKYNKTTISSALVSAPNIAVDEKNHKLLGKTEAEIIQYYSIFKFETEYDYSKNKMLIDYTSGICFLFDAKTKKCIEVEVFCCKFCFSKKMADQYRRGF